MTWKDKTGKAFFRGSRTSSERDALVVLSRNLPQLVDAKYTANQAWRSNADSLGEPPAEPVSLPDHCGFKYLFNYRGVAASFRFKHLFLCRSLVFHVTDDDDTGNDWLEFFYGKMKPWIHYIPISPAATMQELTDVLHWARYNDGAAETIANAGYRFIDEHLTVESVECYWRELLQRYQKLLRYKVRHNATLVKIEAKKDEL